MHTELQVRCKWQVDFCLICWRFNLETTKPPRTKNANTQQYNNLIFFGFWFLVFVLCRLLCCLCCCLLFVRSLPDKFRRRSRRASSLHCFCQVVRHVDEFFSAFRKKRRKHRQDHACLQTHVDLRRKSLGEAKSATECRGGREDDYCFRPMSIIVSARSHRCGYARYEVFSVISLALDALRMWLRTAVAVGHPASKRLIYGS